MVLDGDQLLDVPYVGDRLRKQNEGTPSARGEDSFIGDFCYPTIDPCSIPCSIPCNIADSIADSMA